MASKLIQYFLYTLKKQNSYNFQHISFYQNQNIPTLLQTFTPKRFRNFPLSLYRLLFALKTLYSQRYNQTLNITNGCGVGERWRKVLRSASSETVLENFVRKSFSSTVWSARPSTTLLLACSNRTGATY